jgi:hypothetical protein
MEHTRPTIDALVQSLGHLPLAEIQKRLDDVEQQRAALMELRRIAAKTQRAAAKHREGACN